MASLIYSYVPDSGNLLQDVDHFLVKCVSIENLPNPIAMLNSSQQYLFHGDLFYVVGYSTEMEQYLIRCILTAGGHVSYVLHSGITKVVLGDQAKDSMRIILQRHPCPVDYINLLWILTILYGEESVVQLVQSTISFVVPATNGMATSSTPYPK